MSTTRLRVFLAALAALMALGPVAAAQEGDDATVHAVMFFSPGCGHCEYVIQEVFPVVFDEHGGMWEVRYDESVPEADRAFYLITNGTLEFLLVDVTRPGGADLFHTATDVYDIESNGVPRFIIDDQVYIGSVDIPATLPGHVADGLAAGGVDWPSFDGVAEAVASIPLPDPTTTTTTTAAPPTTSDGSTSSVPGTTTTTTEAGGTTTTSEGSVIPIGGDSESIADRFGRDPVGNTFSVIVLAGMLAALGWVGREFRTPKTGRRPGIGVPVLAAVGIAVASYLSYVETSDATAVCGPVGDCNAVQQSEWAQLFGVIPIGIIGLVGYAVVIAAWLVARTDHNPVTYWARLALFAGTATGVAFSIYLTFLEPFVIGATCAWCLASAIIITALMLLAARPGIDSLRRLRSGEG